MNVYVCPCILQMRDAGLCQALVAFTTMFNPRQPAERLITRDSHQVILQCEEGYFMSAVSVHVCVCVCVCVCV